MNLAIDLLIVLQVGVEIDSHTSFFTLIPYTDCLRDFRADLLIYRAEILVYYAIKSTKRIAGKHFA